jgi:cystathionine beta-lyase/cystathionine gamma-synthase
MKQETKCVHKGTYRDSKTGGVNTPIFTSSSFEYLDRDVIHYPRYFNTPNQTAVVEKMCALEGADSGVLFSSGMASISTTILSFIQAGDHVIMLDELYGGTHAFASEMFNRFNIRYSYVKSSFEEIKKAVVPETKMIIFETPTNPLLTILDIKQVSKFAKERSILTVVDNTFATPNNQNPFKLGVDIVIHSGTKYLGGHSDLCCGVAVCNNEHSEIIRKVACHFGGSLNAITAYLLERSLKTLALRVDRQSENALNVAKFMEDHEAIHKVNYPGLSSFQGHEIAKKQMKKFGAMLSFELNRDMIDTNTFLSRLKLISTAVSLGGVETIICSPAQTSHAKMAKEEREKVGISDSLLRLSVGIENSDDLIKDIKQALDI